MLIKQDLELLERIPEAQTTRRADLQRIIDGRMDDLIHASERSRSLREVASAYKGNWRDALLTTGFALRGLIRSVGAMRRHEPHHG